MKRTFKYIIGIACSLAAVFSCARIEEQEISDTVVKPEKVLMSFTATIADSDQTKTILGGQMGDQYRPILWQVEDSIRVFCVSYWGDEDNSKFTNVENEETEIATFVGEIEYGQYGYRAFYPSSGSVYQRDCTSLVFTQSSRQTYRKNTFDRNAMPMAARAKVGQSFRFRSLCGVLAVNLTGNETVKSVSFSGYDASGNPIPVAGRFVVEKDYTDSPTMTPEFDSASSVTLDCGSGVTLDPSTPTAFYIVLPVATYDTFVISVATTDGKIMLRKGINPLNIKRANVTKAGVLTFVEEVVFNLSDEGTANCYTVSEPGVYSFDATVIGNGDFGIQSSEGAMTGVDIFHTRSTAIVPHTADVLWEAPSGLITNVTFDGQNINFVASGVEGNAVIVAKDADGTILWSWHIWATDQPADQVYVNSLGTYTLMDRNLGATRADRGVGDQWKESVGTFYQYGRKDPLYGRMSSNTTEGWKSYFADFGMSLSVEESIKTPNVFAHGDHKHWNTDQCELYFWQPNAKTIYDPCPVGYRVAVSDAWAGFTYDGQNAYGVSYMNVSGSYNCGWNFIYDGVNMAWYPASIYVDYFEGLYEDSASGYYWGVNGANNNNRLTFWYSSDQECSFDRAGYQNPVYAYPVRCMKDETATSLIVKLHGLTDVTSNSAYASAKISTYGKPEILETGFVVGASPNVTTETGTIYSLGTDIGEVSAQLTGLTELTRYYVRAFATTETGTIYSSAASMITPNTAGTVDLSVNGAANCYIVYPVQGTYEIDLVKGNSNESVGAVSSVEVLWETVNTLEEIPVGTVIESVALDGNKAVIKIPENVRPGNALIAAKSASGKILWSWHFWVTELDPLISAHVYPSGAMMMDRNLGALSSIQTIDNTDVYGLFYQWGRKDPFPGVGQYCGSTFAYTTGEISYVESGSDTNTLKYSILHPNTVINNSDWNKKDDYWNAYKTIYDPCPEGWRIPDRYVWDNFNYYISYPGTGVGWGNGTIGNQGNSYIWSNERSGESYVYKYANSYYYESEWNAYYEFSVRCMKDAAFTVTTSSVSEITNKSAVVTGNVQVLDDTEIDTMGFLYGTDSELFVNDTGIGKLECNGATGVYSATIPDLKPNRTYYVRAYAKGGYNIRYGEIISFKTLAGAGNEGVDNGGDYDWE